MKIKNLTRRALKLHTGGKDKMGRKSTLIPVGENDVKVDWKNVNQRFRLITMRASGLIDFELSKEDAEFYKGFSVPDKSGKIKTLDDLAAKIEKEIKVRELKAVKKDVRPTPQPAPKAGTDRNPDKGNRSLSDKKTNKSQ